MFEGMTVGQIRSQAARDASDVLDAHWDGAYPVGPVTIARALGASVFTAQLGEDEYGRLTSDSAGKNIYIDRDQPRARQRFTCAHEVGHLYSHRSDPNAVFVDLRSDSGRGTANEIYANEFAACLLMPEGDVRVCARRGMSTMSMASYFDVSLSAMSYRLTRLGLDD